MSCVLFGLEFCGLCFVWLCEWFEGMWVVLCKDFVGVVVEVLSGVWVL